MENIQAIKRPCSVWLSWASCLLSEEIPSTSFPSLYSTSYPLSLRRSTYLPTPLSPSITSKEIHVHGKQACTSWFQFGCCSVHILSCSWTLITHVRDICCGGSITMTLALSKRGMQLERLIIPNIFGSHSFILNFHLQILQWWMLSFWAGSPPIEPNIGSPLDQITSIRLL